MTNENNKCSYCGMNTKSSREYHPYAACLMFTAYKNSSTVRANLRAVVEYGMRAERSGISLDDAMVNITLIKEKQDE